MSALDALVRRCVFPEPASEVVCAVSGGADSLALLVLACHTKLNVTAVHVDHGLREGSDTEAEIVEEAATRFGAKFVGEKVSVGDGPNLEERCRVARKQVLGPAAMTGHTADDQAETVLINLMRGAGIAGVAAMEPGFRHPILALRRAETHALCAEFSLKPVSDPSNNDPRFVRNRVRHELIPLLENISERDPVPLLARTAEHARQIQTDLDKVAGEIEELDTRLLAILPVSFIKERLRNWLTDAKGHQPSTADVDKVLAVVRHRSIAADISGGRRVARTKGRLRLEEQPERQRDNRLNG